MVFHIGLLFLNSQTLRFNTKKSIKVHVLRVPRIMFSLPLCPALWSQILSLVCVRLLSVCFTTNYKPFLL